MASIRNLSLEQIDPMWSTSISYPGFRKFSCVYVLKTATQSSLARSISPSYSIDVHAVISKEEYEFEFWIMIFLLDNLMHQRITWQTITVLAEWFHKILLHPVHDILPEESFLSPLIAWYLCRTTNSRSTVLYKTRDPYRFNECEISNSFILGIENWTQPHSNCVKFDKHSASQFVCA